LGRFWSGSGGCGWCGPRGEVRRAGQKGPDVVLVRPGCAARADFGRCAKEKRLLRGLRLRRSEYRRLIFGENRCNRTCGELNSAVRVAAEGPEAGHLGKFGQHSGRRRSSLPLVLGRAWPAGRCAVFRPS
jgi:hypothetical protein